MTYTLAMRAYVARRLAEDFDMEPVDACKWADYLLDVVETGAADPFHCALADALVENYRLEAL